MSYSSGGLLALITHLIVNHDILLRRSEEDDIPAHRSYRAFLIAVIAYFVTDILWGVLYDNHLLLLTSLDTTAYFIAMAASILTWCRFVVDYLNDKQLFGRVLIYVGLAIFLLQMVAVVANFFAPVLFSFDAQGAYHAEAARYITLVAQVAMFFLTAGYALFVASRSTGVVRSRHRAIGLSSLAMLGFAMAQVCYLLLPMYAIGCMLSCCVLHSFVLENEKDEYVDELEGKLRDSIRHGNYYDLLTGLPGMTYFFELSEERRLTLRQEGKQPAFLFLDLSGMKFYNQNHGFAEGDRLLQRFARVLIKEFGERSCSRLGSDHFAVLTHEDGLDQRLQRLFGAWEAEGAQEGHDETPAVRVGVYMDDGQADVSACCDRAKAARDTIRTSYVSSVRRFDSSMLEGSETQRYIVSHLDQALREGWVQVYYQPIVRAVNGRVCDEEALARWNDPERGFLSPADFIPALENANIVYKLDLYVLDEILKKIRVLEEAGLYVVSHSVNLSRADFDACDMVEEFRRRVDAAGVSRDKITVEITESMVGRDFEFMKTQVERFQQLGFAVWMDDFGAGYSSLDILQSIQFDLLKFDMSFMRRLDQGNQGKIVLTELMRMATCLGFDTVCEGVETQEQVFFLREIGCSKLQGYYYTPPISLTQLLERYERGIQIGFENPQETAYFETIGRLNLYDLSVIASEDPSAFQNYFDTLPMGILEVQGNHVSIVRSNRSYRAFVRRVFDLDAKTQEEGIDVATLQDTTFEQVLIRCRQSSDKDFFDKVLPDGSILHAFMRHIGKNPATGTDAIVAVVLSIDQPA